MPALNFREEFVEAIISGEKRQTIRPVRKNPIRAGDTLYIYTGMRTKNCRKVSTVRCVSVDSIEIHPGLIRLNGAMVFPHKLDEFIKADGFDRRYKFFEFFKLQYGLPFRGVVIRWE